MQPYERQKNQGSLSLMSISLLFLRSRQSAERSRHYCTPNWLVHCIHSPAHQIVLNTHTDTHTDRAGISKGKLASRHATYITILLSGGPHLDVHVINQLTHHADQELTSTRLTNQLHIERSLLLSQSNAVCIREMHDRRGLSIRSAT